MDSSLLPRRIIKETQRLLSEPAVGISATPFQDNLRHFNVLITGPQSSPYESGIFKLELFLPEDYPMAPPKVRFLTRIYHPNIDRLGRICLDILKDKWSPALQIRKNTIQTLAGRAVRDRRCITLFPVVPLSTPFLSAFQADSLL